MSEQAVVVVVEDDPNIADLVDMYLRRDDHRVYLASTGEKALEVIGQRSPDLVILDIGLPGEIDGFECCRRIRAESDVPVIMLTARDDEIDRVIGFELGADDYVTKPFSPRELAARVKAILRRSGTPREPVGGVHKLGDVLVDTARREVLLNGEPVSLASQEFSLLLFLLENRGLALSRRQLLGGAWKVDWVGDERTVDVHVRQLRRKLGTDLPLETISGLGYRLG
ncbi:MAG TPA: response regulator transcription factor [Acidimicrobiales bacterium]|jgi:DNA-binding response OmpR family regulator|nr:DNA-binding response regulator [Actinomycetota bacterium]MDP6061670.1 response regulator transcription factor [Acidimicrobiales bacterium]MDP6214303.1 response regulator transcription factor [Acidimicrobiales bacterium]MDP7210000.1 response regulator transcription factor [Acidimicrobiales bacterium]HJL90186.1 response regulator transcription factor [Acidimicrobiales bacterium]